MKKFFLIAANSLALAFSIMVSGQIPAPVPSPTPAADDEVVKISTTLIQVEVVVTDKDGNQVKDLTAEDFEIFENDEKQEITNISYVPVTIEERTEQRKNQNLPTLNPLKPEQVRRSIAIVVDDLSLSFGGAGAVRDALKKYVDTQMQPGDLVAIIRTAGGIGTLQQFTTDKRMLYAAIEKIRWYPNGRGKLGDFSPIEPNLRDILSNVKKLSDGETSGSAVTGEQARIEREMTANAERYRDDIFTVGTLGAINYVIRGMKELPGRKSVLLFSNGFRLIDRDRDGRPTPNSQLIDGVRRLVDLANRSSVVIYTADARGLVGIGLEANDDTFGIDPQTVGKILSERRDELRDTQEGLRFLAEETGGRAFVNNNDLNLAIRKTLDEQKGYYLLAYQPDSDTFDPEERKFNKLNVKIKRPGLKIRYRSGFFGIANRELSLLPQNANRQIIRAITSPFNVADIGLRMNSIFLNDPTEGNIVQSYVHIQGDDLAFKDEPDGWKRANFELLAITFGDNGIPVDQANKIFTIRVKDDSYQKILQDGMVYTMSVPIKKPGAYQLRLAFRDNESGKVGSASQFVEVPDIKKRKLALSGIALENFTNEEWERVSNGWSTTATPQNNAVFDKQSDASLRRYKQNTVLSCAFIVYDAKKSTANLQSQIRLYRDGNLIFEGKPQKIDLTGQTDPTRIFGSKAFSLGKNMPPGNYVLQVSVTDALSSDKNRTASQWIDFEIVN